METDLVDQHDSTATLKTATRSRTSSRRGRLIILCLLLAGVAGFLVVERVARRVSASGPVTVYLLGDPNQAWEHLMGETFRAVGCHCFDRPS